MMKKLARPPGLDGLMVCQWKCVSFSFQHLSRSTQVRQTGKVGSLGSSSGRNQEDMMRLTERGRHWFLMRGVHVRGAAPEGGLFLEGE